jgi:NADH-quinone oxidoreductase subunit B
MEEEEPKPQKSFRNLIDPGAGFGAFVGKLGDTIVKAIDRPLGYAVNWGRMFSLWPVHLETGCCSVELGAASSPRYDLERYGVLEAFGSLRQCDLIIVLGTVNRKMAPRLRLVYDQMPEPKYVIAMGACAITGGCILIHTMYYPEWTMFCQLTYMFLVALLAPRH